MATELQKEWVHLRQKGHMAISTQFLIDFVLKPNLNLRLFTYLFAKARFQDGEQEYSRKGKMGGTIFLKRGEVIASERELARVFGVSQQQIHRAVRFLVDNHFCCRTVCRDYTIISIQDYDRIRHQLEDGKIADVVTTVSPLCHQGGFSVRIQGGSEALSNDVSNVDSKEKNIGDSPKVESPTPTTSSKEKT